MQDAMDLGVLLGDELRHGLDLLGLAEVARHGIDLASLEGLASVMARKASGDESQVMIYYNCSIYRIE